MDHFNYRDGQLYAEDVPLVDIAAQWGSPCFVYSRATLERHWHAFDKALGSHPHKICYSVKANSNIALLNLLARLGSGFDIVSVGELERVLAAGGKAKNIVFSGVGKQADEMRRALEVGIYCFNVESIAELTLLNQVAASMDKQAPVSIRINPDVDPKSHPYISTGMKENKFGIDFERALSVYAMVEQMAHLQIVGVDCHIGSQLTELTPFLDALDRVLVLIDQLAEKNIHIKHLDMGGGLGVRYRDEQPPEPAKQATALMEKIKGRDLEVIVEPGRAIAANAGILLTKIQYVKQTTHKNFAITDAAMNDLIRPSLYQAWQNIIPVLQRTDAPSLLYDVVGPVCETGDFLGKNRELVIQQDDLLAVRTSGAYGFVMSSNYNSRPRAPEVMVSGDKAYQIKPRQRVEDLFADEILMPESCFIED